MGTKRTNRTIEDSLQLPRNPATSVRGNQSNEWISREARPGPAGPKIQVERERGGEEWRSREMDRIRDRLREGRRDVEQYQRERERFAQFKGREIEMDLRERDRRTEQGRYTNGRAASIQQHEEYRESKKGDTFPRTVRQYNERERRTRHSVDQSSETLKEIGTERLRVLDIIEIERERDREQAKKRDKDTHRYREIARQRENERRRLREEMKRNAGRRLEEEDLDQIRLDPSYRERRGGRHTEDSDNNQQILRRREKDRYRDRPRDREDQFYSPQTRRITVGDRENFSDREERDERRRVVRKERHRYTKSEGDTDGETEREVTRKEDAVSLKFDGRSEVDNEKERTRDRMRERERRREVERQKERERRKEKETALRSWGREGNKEYTMERYRERDMRERDWAREEKGTDGQRDQRRGTEDRRTEKELNERMRREYERERVLIPPAEREMDMHVEWAGRQRQNNYEEEMTGRSSQTQKVTDRKIQEEAQSKERQSASESDREKKRSEEGQDTAWGLKKEEAIEGSEKEEMGVKKEKEREHFESKMKPHKKMWLEPRSGREKTESLQEDYKEREQARERYAQRYNEKTTSRGEEEMSAERKNGRVTELPEDRCRELDSTAEFMKDVDTENLEERTISDEMVFDSEDWLKNVADDMEGSDREEEQGSDRYVNSEGEDESEGACQEWRDKVASGDDGFVTVSSGAEEYETEEDRFEDCTEFWDGEDNQGLARESPTSSHQKEGEIETRMTKERSDRTVTVFCVVGQTLPRSPLLDHMEQEKTSHGSSWETDGAGGDQDEAPNRDTEAGSTGTDHGLSLSEEDMSSSHDTKCDNAEPDQITKEVTPSYDLVISGNVIAEKDTEPNPTESIETLTHIEDHGNAQTKVTDGENQVERQNEMESTCHLEETESAGDRKRFSAAPHVKWAKNVLSEILDSTEDVPEPSTLTEQAGDGATAEAQSEGDSPLYGIVQKPRKHNHDRKCIDPELLHVKPEDTKTDIQVGNEILLQVEGQSEGEEELEQLSASPDLQSFSSDNETDKEGSSKKEKKQKKKAVWNILGSNSFRELGNEVWGRRVGIRKTLPKHNEEEEGEGAGRDRRTRVFTTGERRLDVNWYDVI